jgi:hypothetical protein
MRLYLALLVGICAALLTDASSLVRGNVVTEEDAALGHTGRRAKEKKTKGMGGGKKGEGALPTTEEVLPVTEERPSPPIQYTKNPSFTLGSKDVMMPPKRTKRSSKKHSSKGGKLVKSMKGSGKKSKRGKGKGKGKGAPPLRGCTSPVADAIVEGVPEVITRTPKECCGFKGPTAVFVTHAQRDADTRTGFEPFWDDFYQELVKASRMAHVCFVMTGYDQDNAEIGLSEILIDVNTVASNLAAVPVIMTTDPTTDVNLLNLIREISDNAALPSIGIFNTGYGNILIESIVSGMKRLPFVGLADDADYGTEAGRLAVDLLGDMAAVPLCFNARPDLLFVAERCAAFYGAITFGPIDPAPGGVICSADSLLEDILNQIVDSGANALFSHIDCCSAVAKAAEMASEINGREIVVGCSDEDPTGGKIDFVTALPIELQAYQSSSWANLPVIQSQLGKDGRGEQYFPSLASLINTDVFNTIIM